MVREDREPEVEVEVPEPEPEGEPEPAPSGPARPLAGTGGEVQVEGRRLKISNLEKVLYPVPGFTKGQVLDYYIRVAPALLPHLRDRPLTLKRYPNGVDSQFFYEKNSPATGPSGPRPIT